MKFSVLMSVYIDEKPEYLDQALQSIWDNQSLRPDEIVLVKDGILTKALELTINVWLEKIGSALKIIPLKQNVGLGSALNIGINHCTHELVARMDTDDVASVKRFEFQIKYMVENKDIAASSGYIEEWDECIFNKLDLRTVPLEQDEILRFARRRSPLNHPATIFRKSVILESGGYPPLRKAQDYALWSKLLVEGYKLGNINSTLIYMRSGSDMVKRRGINQLKMEYQMLKYQKEIGFLNRWDFSCNLAARTVLRLVPVNLKTYIYKNYR